MRYASIALLFAVVMTVAVTTGAETDESARADSETATTPGVSEKEVDAEILDIEKSVSGADDVEEFVPRKPLSADKAIALPSDI